MLCWNTVAAVPEFFVDAQQGNDAHDGQSEATPLATLSAAFHKLAALGPEEPAILNLARGSVWRESYSPKHFRPEQLNFLAKRTKYPAGDEAMSPLPEGQADLRRWPNYHFSRDHLTVRAYGEGELPTISGTEDLPNERFQRHDPERFPNLWSQEVVPPLTHWIFAHGNPTVRAGVIVDGTTPLLRIYPPLAFNVRDYDRELSGIKTDADAMAFVNGRPGSFFARENGDGSFTYFVNPGSDPTTDGRKYEYKARGSFITGNGITLENIRFYGLNERDGLSSVPLRFAGVEVLFGDVHNMLIGTGHFVDVISDGYRAGSFEVLGFNPQGDTHSVFHTHAPDSAGIVYDRCIARNARIAFFDHHANANRPAAVIRDSRTENINTVFAHGNSTRKGFLIGHYHEGPKGTRFSNIGGMTSGQNYIEDSIFRFDQGGRDAWHKTYGGHLRMRNSVLHVGNGTGDPRVIFLPAGNADWEYENVTLILDLSTKAQSGSLAHAPLGEGASPGSGKWVFRNCVIAVLGGAPGNVRESPGGPGMGMSLARFQNLPYKFENCVLTYIDGISDSAGVEGEDYVFARVSEIFSGNPAEGDYSLNPDGPAAQRDAGYREGREPVFRLKADEAVRAMPFVQ